MASSSPVSRPEPLARPTPGTWAALLHAAHRDHGPRPALHTPCGVWSYDQVLACAARVAAALHARGLAPGARVVLAAENRAEIAVLERALALWGWVRVAVSPRLHPREIDCIAADCEASMVVCEPAIADRLNTSAIVVSVERDVSPGAQICLDELMEHGGDAPGFHDAQPQDIASLMYTSGTTGWPKGAINTHGNWHAMATGLSATLPPLSTQDVLLHVAPMSHFSGSVASAFISAGASLAMMRRFIPEKVAQAARHVGATCVPLVPTMLGDLVQAIAENPQTRIPSLRVVPYGGSTVATDTLLQAREKLGDVLLQIYGMSEALVPVTALSIAEHGPGADQLERLTSAGRPAGGIEVNLAEPDEGVGEICVRGPNVMAGYWGRPEQSAEVLSKDGWYRSGDLGRWDAAGRLHVVDRKRDVVISGGFNVYPAEVERVISNIDGVAAVAVFGVPHPRWGEAVMAAVVPAPGSTITREQILDVCRAELASYKKPLAIDFVNELPRTSTGKVTKARLREQYAAAAPKADSQGVLS